MTFNCFFASFLVLANHNAAVSRVGDQFPIWLLLLCVLIHSFVVS